MEPKSIIRFLHHDVVYRVEFLYFNKTVVLSSKKSDSTMVLLIFDDTAVVLSDFFDESTMVLLKSKNQTR